MGSGAAVLQPHGSLQPARRHLGGRHAAVRRVQQQLRRHPWRVYASALVKEKYVASGFSRTSGPPEGGHYDTLQNHSTTSDGYRSPVPTNSDRVSICSSGAAVSNVGTVRKYTSDGSTRTPARSFAITSGGA